MKRKGERKIIKDNIKGIKMRQSSSNIEGNIEQKIFSGKAEIGRKRHRR
jgi:hypothetical protein